MPGEAIVVGGGIGGLAAGLALVRVGWRVRVYEAAPEIREVGAGLSLWSNAFTALRRLGVADRVARLGTRVTSSTTLSSRGAPLGETDLEPIAAEAGEPCVCVHRADLQRELAEALHEASPGTLVTGKRCTGVRPNGESATAEFEDGDEATGDVVIGADGIHSRVRECLFGAGRTRYAGYTCWRGMAPFADDELEAGRVFYGVGHGQQIGLFGCGSGRAYWFVTRNSPPGRLLQPDEHKPRLLEWFKDWPEVIKGALEATPADAIIQGDIIDRPPTRNWGKGRVTLLGDAVHSTTPNLGQGACMALESAVVLAHLIRHGEVPGALREYENRRRERTALVTNESWKFGRVMQWQNPLAVRLRDFLLGTSFAQNQAGRLLRKLLIHDLPSLD